MDRALSSQREFERRISRSFEFMPVEEARRQRQAGFPSLRPEYFLAEVWNRNSFAGSQIQINPRQTELAKNQSKDEVVLIASEK